MIDPYTQNYLNKQFNPNGSALRRYQLYLLQMLKDVVSICDENKIDYCLAYGTCLGAVRHEGFIPWDDDIDIHIKKQDYKRLRDAIGKDPRFIFQDNKSDAGYVFPFAKIRTVKSDLILNENGDWDIDYKFKTPYIDVFPFDDKAINTSINKLCFRLYALPQKTNFLRGKYLRVLTKKLLFVIIDKILVPFVTYFNKKVDSESITCVPATDYNILKKNDLFPFCNLIFEGEIFKCPHNPDGYLQSLYGDYNKLPKMDEIRVHLDPNCLDYFS